MVPSEIPTMRPLRYFLVGLLLLAAASAGFLMLRGLGLWESGAVAEVRRLERGHQEIAWISPATNTDAWERLVSALTYLEKDWGKMHGTPDLKVDFDRAFLDLTADVPEIGLRRGDSEVLWVRWYKISGNNDIRTWVERLRKRGRPPLAVLGGETTDRAYALASALEEVRSGWNGTAPLFLMTTATADAYAPVDDRSGTLPHAKWPRLIETYPGRTFRYCFTNQRMVEAVLDFVAQHPQVSLQRRSDASVFAGAVAQGNPWGVLGILAATEHLRSYYLYPIAWWDDGYSRDLAQIFFTRFHARFAVRDRDEPIILCNPGIDQIDYSVGDYYQPNPREAGAVGRLLAHVRLCTDRHQLLVLPTGVQRARRFLRDFCRQAPLESRRIVVLTGDAVSFNHVYRDRDYSWNVLDMPVPLVFFSHRNPIDEKAGFRPRESADGAVSSTATNDMLLYRDVVESFLLAAFDGSDLQSDADRVLERLRETRWYRGRVYHPRVQDYEGYPFFDADGNRLPGTGEHVVWLSPHFDAGRIAPHAALTVWGTSQRDTRSWKQRGRTLIVSYTFSGAPFHAGP